MRFEDDSIESAKVVKQWNVKIISVSNIAIDTNNFLAFALFFQISHCCYAPVHCCQYNEDVNVTVQISKNKRHQDRAAALEVWGKLEEFVARSRS